MFGGRILEGFSDIALDHANEPRNQGRMRDPTATGRAALGRGAFVRIYLRAAGPVVEHATFECFACSAAIAAGSLLTELARGRTAAECRQITAPRLDAALGGLPPNRRFCAALAVRALRSAVENWLEQDAG